MKAIKEAIQKLATMGSIPASLQSMLEAALREDEQHQGEPVAFAHPDGLAALRKHFNGNWPFFTGVSSHRSNFDGVTVPLYTHADPAEVASIKADRDAFAQNAIDLRAEVERLSRKAANADLALAAQTKQVHNLRAQLAEAHALLRNLRPAISMVLNALDRDAAEGKAARGEMAAELREALSASAEPSAPAEMERLGQPFAQILADNADDLILKSSVSVEIDERVRLEAYCTKVGLPLDQLPSGEYLIPATRFVSQGWHAHAALERKP